METILDGGKQFASFGMIPQERVISDERTILQCPSARQKGILCSNQGEVCPQTGLPLPQNPSGAQEADGAVLARLTLENTSTSYLFFFLWSTYPEIYDQKGSYDLLSDDANRHAPAGFQRSLPLKQRPFIFGHF